MTSRKGRDLQRYNEGYRQVVGCIPCRFRKLDKPRSIHDHETSIEELEFLLISSQKSTKWMFPKGGWELDETMEEAAIRETMEEAGVCGIVENKLGMWTFKSRSQDLMHEGHMFAFLVMEELDDWPEKDVRRRIWLTASEAREKCVHDWMKDALDSFVSLLTQLESKEEEHRRPRLLDFLRLAEERIRKVAESGEEEEEEIDSGFVPLDDFQERKGMIDDVICDDPDCGPILDSTLQPTVSEAKEKSEHEWIKYALDVLIRQLKETESKEEQPWTPRLLDYLRLAEERIGNVEQNGEEEEEEKSLIITLSRSGIFRKWKEDVEILCSLQCLVEDSRTGLVAQSGEEDVDCCLVS